MGLRDKIKIGTPAEKSAGDSSFEKQPKKGTNFAHVRQLPPPPKITDPEKLEKEEIELLLTLIKNTTFSGNLLDLVYRATKKLQNQYTKL